MMKIRKSVSLLAFKKRYLQPETDKHLFVLNNSVGFVFYNKSLFI